MAETVFVTGFPWLLARGLVIKILRVDPENRVFLLATPEQADAAEDWLATVPDEGWRRVELLKGRLEDVDLGLAGRDVNRLLAETTLVFHAATYYQGPRAQLRSRNVGHLGAVLGLAREMVRLQRLCFFSTAFVSGDRTGLIREEELECGQGFRTPYEESMYLAEQLARSMMPRLPITVFRPSAMIGHSRTGEASGLTEGPNYLVKLMVRLPAEVPFLLPGSGGVPFNIVPIDYVVRAAWSLARMPEAQGRTFHLTDPNPLSARKAFELLGELADRSAPFVGGLPVTLMRRALRLTGLGRLAPNKLALLEDLTTHVTYSCEGALELLARTTVSCPPFESYADTLVGWVAEYERSARLRQ